MFTVHFVTIISYYILTSSAAFNPEQISHRSISFCGHADQGDAPVTYKDREVFLDLSSGGSSNRTTITNCSTVFRSPFNCPHPYSLQVIEDNPQKCHHNFQMCVHHQRVYWTEGGELEVHFTNLHRLQSTSYPIILHVIRLDCDSKLKASVEGLKMGGTSPSIITNRLRVDIKNAGGDFVAMEESYNSSAHSKPQPHLITSDEGMKKNFLFVPKENANFFLTSPGFPRNPNGYSDCFFVVPRTNVQTCRLRINFRFFNLPDPDERTCQYHFLVIDNKRICGCKTGLVYLTQMDSRPKIIRYVNKLTAGIIGQQRSVGFLLEVQREACPYRYLSGVAKRDVQRRREVEPVLGFYNNHTKSRQSCQFSFNDWMRVLANPVWANRRPQCTAGQNIQYLNNVHF